MSTSRNMEESSESVSDSRKRLTSAVWDKFTVVETGEGQNKKRRAVCKLCGKDYAADSVSGTSNLKRHLLKHHSGCELGVGPVRLSSVDQDRYREKMTIAIIRHDYPFQFVEHEGNRELHAFLNPTVQFISRNTAKSDVLKFYKKEKENLVKQLEMVPGRICLTTDLWSSITSEGYMSLTAHYIDDKWKLQNKLLIFRHVPPPHTGQFLADRLYAFLKEWGIEKKIFTITVDNAKYNDRLVSDMEAYFSFDESSICGSQFLHVRCGAHILNLIVRAGLDVIGGSINKIRESVKYIKGSEGRMKKFGDIVKRLSLASNKKSRQDVSTRWNSTFPMLERALLLQHAFYQLQRLDDAYVLCHSEEEWNRVERVARFLKPFYDLTTLFSGRKYPTANLYFQNVWKIELLLRKEADGEDYLISNMAGEMKSKFHKYWECYSMVLSFAIILDPRYKMQFVDYYFEKLDSAIREIRVSDVEKILKRMYEEYSRTGGSS